jgi:hypothetical protein
VEPSPPGVKNTDISIQPSVNVHSDFAVMFADERFKSPTLGGFIAQRQVD